MTIRDFLKNHDVPFRELRSHEAAELGAKRHDSSTCITKTRLLRADHGFRYVLTLFPAICEVDEPRVSQLLGGANLVMCDRQECHEICGVTRLCPFGSLYGLLTIVDRRVGEKELIAFKDELGQWLSVPWVNFLRSENPLVGEIALVRADTNAAIL